MITWAGRILVFFGFGHLVGAMALTSWQHADSWFTADLWRLDEGVVNMSPAMAAFWLTTGSFSVPLVVIGLIVLWLNRRDVVPPPFIGWTIGIWSVVAAVILEPSPFVLVSIASGLLLAGGRSAAPAQRTLCDECGVDRPSSIMAPSQQLSSEPGSPAWRRSDSGGSGK